ncbi:MAG: hypothetical protein ACI4Q3_01640 [Kiritimatiellia bacterium]
MIEIKISVDTSKADRLLSDFPGLMATARKNALNAIGAEMASRAGRAFRSESLRPLHLTCLQNLLLLR